MLQLSVQLIRVLCTETVSWTYFTFFNAKVGDNVVPIKRCFGGGDCPNTVCQELSFMCKCSLIMDWRGNRKMLIHILEIHRKLMLSSFPLDLFPSFLSDVGFCPENPQHD